MTIKHIIGIDEAGRGPLAGPIAVSAVRINIEDYDKDQLFFEFKQLNDSKKVTPRRREILYKKIKEAQKAGFIDCAISFSSNRMIDKKGIMPATYAALDQCLNKCAKDPKNTLVLLDGGLHASRAFTHQETIIKGDEKEPIIMLASILAKVSRDRKMVELSNQYPEYGFELHKGYGTKAHYIAIKKNGFCNIHRRSFCKKILINKE